MPRERKNPRAVSFELFKPPAIGAYPKRHVGRSCFLTISFGESKIVGYRASLNASASEGLRMLNDLKGRPFFNDDSSLLELHLSSTNARETIELFKSLAAHSTEIKEAGFSGIFGITQNHAVLDALGRAFPGFETAWFKPCVPEQRALAERYMLKVKENGYPEKYAYLKARGLAIRL